MTEAEFVAKLALELKTPVAPLRRQIREIMDEMAAAIVSDNRFEWPGFGTWTVRLRRARWICNPQTGERMKLPATKTIGFRPSKHVAARLNAKRRRARP